MFASLVFPRADNGAMAITFRVVVAAMVAFGTIACARDVTAKAS
ncbi:MAG TPA: hypothetical protein VHD59_13240 [Pseudolabrys sp.]|jgi:hypothetical protein|nr:hypothetical protein [Pseudolabrys sp.]